MDIMIKESYKRLVSVKYKITEKDYINKNMGVKSYEK